MPDALRDHDPELGKMPRNAFASIVCCRISSAVCDAA